jgi:hypothetical protein
MRPRERVFFDKATAFVSEGLGLAVHLQGFDRAIASRHQAGFEISKEGT